MVKEVVQYEYYTCNLGTNSTMKFISGKGIYQEGKIRGGGVDSIEEDFKRNVMLKQIVFSYLALIICLLEI